MERRGCRERKGGFVILAVSVNAPMIVLHMRMP